MKLAKERKIFRLGHMVGLVVSIGIIAVIKVLSLGFVLGAISTLVTSMSLDALFMTYVGYLFRFRDFLVEVPAFILGTMWVSHAIEWLLNLHPNLITTTEINVLIVLWNFLWFCIGLVIRGSNCNP